MILIIAEKPSLGRNIATALGATTKKAGYIEGNGYLVSWAFGHLFSLADIETYDTINKPVEAQNTSNLPQEKKRWTMDNLPCFPEKFHFRLRSDDQGIRKQFDLISTLCNRNDVDTIVNAGDADREGEIIVRLCISHALKSEKRMLRLWLPDQTPETIRHASQSMKDEKDYELLAKEGYARTYIDWLYGVNLTRYATLRTGTLLRVGRVIVPIVRAIYDRDLAIRNFVKEKYYAIASKTSTDGEEIELVSKKRLTKDEHAKAQECSARYNLKGASVLSVKQKRIP